jgi:hypothetical protein
MNPDGKIRVANIQPITVRTYLERPLGEGEKLEPLGRLAMGLAHDFDNILAGIVAYWLREPPSYFTGSAPPRDGDEAGEQPDDAPCFVAMMRNKTGRWGTFGSMS